LIGNNSGDVDQNALQQITTLIGQRAKGDWTPQQRAQLNDAVAKVAKISPDDARRRVDEAENTSTVQCSRRRILPGAPQKSQGKPGLAPFSWRGLVLGQCS